MKPNPAPNLVDAACAAHPNPEWWTPRDARDPAIPAAVLVCETACPALDACEAWADRHQPTAGIWAGTLRGVGWG